LLQTNKNSKFYNPERLLQLVLVGFSFAKV